MSLILNGSEPMDFISIFLADPSSLMGVPPTLDRWQQQSGGIPREFATLCTSDRINIGC